MDKRKFNGGNKNAGRKPKAEEQKLVEKLKPLEPLAYKALENGLKADQQWAVKLWFEYFNGKPKETKDISISSFEAIDMSEWK